MKQTGIHGKFADNKNIVTVNLQVMIFLDNGTSIAYIPALDISGYGKTEPEAKSSLEHSLNEYFSYTLAKNTLIKDLKAHNWTIAKKNKPFIAPDITDLIGRNEYLHDILNMRSYKMDRMDVAMPQYA